MSYYVYMCMFLFIIHGLALWEASPFFFIEGPFDVFP